MELYLSPPLVQVNDNLRPVEVEAVRPAPNYEYTGREEDPAEGEASEAKEAPGDGDEEPSLKSAVDSDTGQNIDLSV
jgi:hypothetical protein|tara:strand:- start:377 stop:607 length:231 start_codon:yes stop_codon:yes gene_type:complete